MSKPMSFEQATNYVKGLKLETTRLYNESQKAQEKFYESANKDSAAEAILAAWEAERNPKSEAPAPEAAKVEA